jgi:hypothetical protein
LRLLPAPNRLHKFEFSLVKGDLVAIANHLPTFPVSPASNFHSGESWMPKAAPNLID